MIPLVTPEKITQERTRAAVEGTARMRGLALEETRLVGSVNMLRAEEQELRKKAAQDEAAREAGLAVRKSALEIEVQALEARRDIAMVPVRAEMQRVEQQKAENKARANDLDVLSAHLEAEREDLVAKAEAVIDREQRAKDRDESLDRREAGIGAAEAEIKRSTDELSGKWVAYHEAVISSNEQIDRREAAVVRRENAVAGAEQANETRASALAAKEKELWHKEIGLTDRYAVLESAIKEAREKGVEI